MVSRFRDFSSRDWEVPTPQAAEPTQDTKPAKSLAETAFGAVNVDSAGVVKPAAQVEAEKSGTTLEEVNKQTRERAETPRKVKSKTIGEPRYTAREQLMLDNARSAREREKIRMQIESARAEAERKKSGEIARQAVEPTSQPSREQINEQKRQEKANARAEEKVGNIWETHAHLVDSSAPKREELDAMATNHPLAAGGARDLLQAANQVYSTLGSYIRNPGPHLEKSAKLGHFIADKIEKVKPGHTIATQLRDWADKIASPVVIKNMAAKLGGGRGSANDALVNAGAALHAANKASSQNSEVLVDGKGTARPVFTVANPSEQVHAALKTLWGKLKTVHSKIQSSLPDGVVHPVDHVLVAAGLSRAESLQGGTGFMKDSSPDYDPVTGAFSQPNHIWDHTDRYKLGSEAGTAKQIEVTPENHELLKKRGVASLTSIMASKLKERQGGITRGERGTTAKIALSPTTLSTRDAASQEGSMPFRAIDVRRLPEHHRAYQDTKGNYYHPENETRYRQGDLGPDNKPVKLSVTRYWKPVQE